MFAKHRDIDHGSVDVPEFDGTKQTFDAVHNLESAAVTKCQDERETIIARCLLDTAVKLFLGALGQISQSSNRLKTHILLEQFRRFLLQKLFHHTDPRTTDSSALSPHDAPDRAL